MLVHRECCVNNSLKANQQNWRPGDVGVMVEGCLGNERGCGMGREKERMESRFERLRQREIFRVLSDNPFTQSGRVVLAE